VQSPEWQEAEIKEKLGYGKPGETVLILPKETSDQGPAMPAGRQVLGAHNRKSRIGGSGGGYM